MSGYWALMPNTQKGMRIGRNIWHYVIIRQPTSKYPFFWEDGTYYSICRATISAVRQLGKSDIKPPYKDCCKDCVRIWNKLGKDK